MPASKTRPKFAVPVPVMVGAIVVALGLSAWQWMEFQARRHPPQPRVLTAEAKQYVRNLKLNDVHIKAAESYMKQAVVEIDGKITNAGDRVLKLVEVNCVFRDPYGQVVLREPRAIAGGGPGRLAPGETKSFRLAFDNLPESWNQAMPELVIAQILFV